MDYNPDHDVYYAYGFIAFLVALALGVGVLIYWCHQSRVEYDARCRASGGVPAHFYKSHPLCLDPGSLRAP